MRILSALILPARIEHLSTFIASVTGAAEAEGVNQKKIFDIELALEEALVNIINYAYKEQPGDIEVVCKSDGGEWLVIEITDKGAPFDVLSVPPPDITLDLSERETGGLGIYFMRKVMDLVAYRREGEKNILELRLRITV